MAKNEFKMFAVNEDANVLSQEEYEALEALGTGFQSGIARSEQLNKVWRQASIMSAVLADFIATQSGNDVIDDGDLVKIRASLLKALLAYSTNQLDSRYLNVARNLSDLKDVPAARKSLGLKGAALLDVGAASGTVAAGNDSRIVNAVPNTRKVNGHPLTSDFDISAADVKALAITTVRAGINPSAGNVGDANELPANATSFVYSNAGNAPTFTGSLLDFSGLGNGYNAQIVAAYAGAGERIGFRTRNGDKKTWNPWYEFYHNGNKPSPSDVGALPVNAPELSVNLNTLGHPTASIGLYFQGSSAAATAANNYPILEAGSLLVARTAYGCQQEYTTYGSGRKFVRGLTGSFNGSGPWGPWKEYLLTTANAASASKLATARTIAGVAFDGQSNIAIPASNVGAYTKAEVDSRLNTKGALNTASKAVNGWWKCGSTGVIIQWGQIPAANGERVVAVTFPVAFPNAVRSMSGIIANPSENVELDAFLEYSNLNNRASVRLMLGNTTGGWSMGGCWMAIGY